MAAADEELADLLRSLQSETDRQAQLAAWLAGHPDQVAESLWAAKEARAAWAVPDLVAAGASTEVLRDGRSLLIESIDQRSGNVSRALIAAGADLNRMVGSNHPLLVAWRYRKDLVLPMLQTGRVDLFAEVPGRRGSTRVLDEILQQGRGRDGEEVHAAVIAQLDARRADWQEDPHILLAACNGDSPLNHHLLQHGSLPDLEPEATKTEPETITRGDLLHRCLATRSPGALRILLERGVDPDSRDEKGLPALCAAVTHAGQSRSGSDTSMTQALLAAGADVDLADEGGMTPLFHAIRRRDLDHLLVFQEAGADLAAVHPGAGSATHVAVATGSAGLVDYVLRLGAPLSAPDADGRTPLAHAQQRGSFQLAQWLEKRGATGSLPEPELALAAYVNEADEVLAAILAEPAPDSPRLTGLLERALLQGDAAVVARLLQIDRGPSLDDETFDWRSWLQKLVMRNKAQLVGLLLDHGVPPDDPDQRASLLNHVIDQRRRWLGDDDPEELADSAAIRDALLAAGADPGFSSRYQIPLVHRAVWAGDLETLKALVAAGADATVVDGNGHSLVDTCAQSGNVAILAWLRQQPGITVTVPDDALFGAIRQGDAALLRSWLDLGAAVDQPDGSGRSVLHEAVTVKKPDASLIAMLLEAGAAVDALWQSAADRKLQQGQGPEDPPVGRTPLLLALDERHPEIAAMLLAAGADPRIAAADGVTCLHHAAGQGLEDLVRTLLARGARADARTLEVERRQRQAHGQTPLHWACRDARRTAGVAALLLEAGAPIDARDSEGASAYDLAAQHGDSPTAALLQRHGADTTGTDHEQVAMSQAIGRRDWEAVQAVARDRPDLLATTGLLHRVAGDPQLAETLPWVFTQAPDIDARDERQYTPLMYAIAAGNLPLVKELLQRQASVELVSRIERVAGTTPLLVALGYSSHGPELDRPDPLERRAEIVSLLLDQGADPNRAVNAAHPLHQALGGADQLVLAKLLLAAGADATWRNPTDYGVFSKVRLRSVADLGVVELLLEHGADLTRIGRSATPLLFDCLQVEDATEALAIHDALVELGAPIDRVDRHRYSLLIRAVRFGQADLVAGLLARGHAVDWRDQMGWTALHWAEAAVHNPRPGYRPNADWPGCRTALLAAGAAETGISAAHWHMHWALDRGDRKQVEALLAENQDLLRNWPSSLPGPLPLQMGGTDLAKLLLQHGADPAGSRNGATVLMHAAHYGDAELVQALLDAGADPAVKDRRGNTALDFAKRRRAKAVVELLRRHQRSESEEAPPDELPRTDADGF